MRLQFVSTWALAACLAAPLSVFAQAVAPAQELRFNFASEAKAGATNVKWSAAGAPLYDAALGYGFVSQTSALPARPVHTSQIRSQAHGFVISEPSFEVDKAAPAAHYNHFGMAFRFKAPPGAYAIKVRTTSDAADTIVAVSGMQTSRLTPNVFWDAAALLPNQTSVIAKGKDWSYRYVNGQEFIDIEIEPAKVDTPVGIEEIVVTPIAPQARAAGVPPTVYTLGDSTVKSYTFEEAPMSGWGQLFDQLFDPRKARVLNYSMGGRSFKSAYTEGRLNDLLLAGRIGDIILIQFGHNDESEDDAKRWGRGASEAMYEKMIRDVYLPAIRARGMSPVLVTPMSRVNGDLKPGAVYVNSFKKRLFPDLMKKIGAELGVPVVDLNARSVEYYNQNGVEATTAIVMSIEAGETPGKTNDGSYANGHPSKKIDGTHVKEAMAKQYARIVATELAGLAKRGNATATRLVAALRGDVQAAIAANDWSAIQPELARDVMAGEGSYYRNQIEKLLQLGVLRKDAQGNFNPAAPMRTAEFTAALARLMGIPASTLAKYPDGVLTREAMGAIVADAYHAKYSEKPKYMTAYNGKTVLPGSPGYDPNLDSGAKGAMYYPLTAWSQLSDTAELAPAYAAKVQDAYELGLIRSEVGIARGRMVNGSKLEPKAQVTRAKAAKALYFMWVLAQPVQLENDTITVQ